MYIETWKNKECAIVVMLSGCDAMRFRHVTWFVRRGQELLLGVDTHCPLVYFISHLALQLPHFLCPGHLPHNLVLVSFRNTLVRYRSSVSQWTFH